MNDVLEVSLVWGDVVIGRVCVPFWDGMRVRDVFAVPDELGASVIDLGSAPVSGATTRVTWRDLTVVAEAGGAGAWSPRVGVERALLGGIAGAATLHALLLFGGRAQPEERDELTAERLVTMRPDDVGGPPKARVREDARGSVLTNSAEGESPRVDDERRRLGLAQSGGLLDGGDAFCDWSDVEEFGCMAGVWFHYVDRTTPPAVVCGPAMSSHVGMSGVVLAEVVHRTVRAQDHRFLHCYEAALAHDPSLRGSVVVEFAIAASGHVAWAREAKSSTLPDPVARACVVQTFTVLSFDPTRAGLATVRYPLAFSRL